MNTPFECAGDMADWPKNESGKPTQAAVFGVLHPDRGKVCEILWTGQFPDLDPAMYWAAKKEVEAVRKGKWMIASRVLWQHDLTPEQAVETTWKTMSPQIDRAMQSLENDGEFDLGEGPAHIVDPSQAKGYYVEVVDENDEEGDPLASFFTGPPSNDVDVTWVTGKDEPKAKDQSPDGPRTS